MLQAFSSSVILEGREGDSQPSDHSDIDSEDEVAGT